MGVRESVAGGMGWLVVCVEVFVCGVAGFNCGCFGAAVQFGG